MKGQAPLRLQCRLQPWRQDAPGSSDRGPLPSVPPPPPPAEAAAVSAAWPLLRAAATRYPAGLQARCWGPRDATKAAAAPLPSSPAHSPAAIA